MNKILALQISLLVSFAQLNGMSNALKGLVGMDKTYSCDYTKNGKINAQAMSVKIVDSDFGKGCWFSKDDTYHDVKKGIFSLKLGSDILITIEGECLAAVMKAIATRTSFAIETVIPDSSPMLWAFQGDGKPESRQRAAEYYTNQLSSSLKSANKNLGNVAIASGEGALQKSSIVASLQIPSALNPFGSLGVRVENEENLAINTALADSLLDFSMLTEQDTPQNNNIVIDYQDGSSSSTKAFLDRNAVIEKLPSYFSALKWRNRGVFGLSAAALLALVCYFNFKK